MDAELDQRLARIEARLSLLESEAFGAPEVGTAPVVHRDPAVPGSTAPGTPAAPAAPIAGAHPDLRDSLSEPVQVPVIAQRRGEFVVAGLTPTAARAAGTDAGPTPTGAPGAPPPRRRPVQVKSSSPARAQDFERFFGVAVLGRVGVAAVLLAAGYFAQMAYREATELGRVTILAGGGAAFLGVGWLLRARAARHYVGLLWGAGTALLWIAGVAAHLRYQLVGSEVGLLLAVLGSAIGTVHARVLRSEWLASTALAGAYAAPLLLMPQGDARTFLTCFSLLLYGWSLWCQRRLAWGSAHAVALVGMLLVAAAWVSRTGAWDLSTWLHLQAVIVGLTLLELVALARRWPMSSVRADGTTALTATLQGLLVVPFVLHIDWGTPSPLRWSVALVGATYYALATWLTPRASEGAMRLGRGLGHLGAVLLPIGLLGWILDVAPATGGRNLWTAAALALLATSLVALQRRSGTGPLGAAVCGLLACGVFLHPAGDSLTHLAVLALCFSPALTLGCFAQGQHFPAAGSILAACTALIGATWFGLHSHDVALDVTPLGYALGVGASLVLAWRGRGPASAAPATMVLLGLLWLLRADIVRLGETATALFNTRFLTALVVAAGAFVLAVVRLREEGKASSVQRQTAGLTAALVLLIAGYMEASEFATLHAGSTRGLVLVAYVALATYVLALACRRARPPWLVPLSGILMWIAALHTLGLPGRAPAAGVVLAGYALVAGLPFVLTHALGSLPGLLTWRSASALVLSGAWLFHQAVDRLPNEPRLFNERLAAGALTLLAGIWTARLASKVGRRRLAALLACVALMVAYVLGLREVLELVRHAAGAWPAVAVSLYSTGYAGALLALGFGCQLRHLRYLALGIFGVVILKVGLYDLRASELPLRVLVTGVLGLVLLVAAFTYARKSQQPIPDADSSSPE